MTKWVISIATALLLTASIAIAGNNEGKAKSMVDSGLAHIEVVGPEQAAKDFMTPAGGFLEGSYYLLFYTYDGTCLALGAKPEIAGKNRWDVQDADGIYQVREMVKAARSGGGWVNYTYANPTTGTLQKKKTWVLPVPGMNAFVGCGIYY